MKRFFQYAALNMLGMLGISFYILADTFFVANGVGADGLAALNLAIPVYSFVHGCALMLGTGGATKYTIARSQGEHARANIIFNNCLLITLVTAAVFIALGLCCAPQIALLLGSNEALFEMTTIYLKVILLFAPFFMCNELFLAFIRSDGNPALAMTAMVSGSVANIILDYIFIYPLHMGILGAVLATGIAPIVSMSILSAHKLQKRNQFHLRKTNLHTESILGSMILGFPALVSEVSIGLVMIVLNILIMSLAGSTGVAAYGIIANIAIVATSVFNGLTQGVQPLVSTAYGQGDPGAVNKYLQYALVTVAVISAGIYGCIYLYVTPITALFNSEQNTVLQSMAEYGLLLYFLSIPFAGINTVLSGFFTALEIPLPAHAISLLRGLIIVIPAAYLLSALFGLTGIWLTLPITEAIVAVLSVILWVKRKSTP